jgi:uncharacterized protein YyaL (SSP411 family)
MDVSRSIAVLRYHSTMRINQCMYRAVAAVIVVGLGSTVAMSNENPSGGHSFPANRLVNETSPYLLQHAYNPVHWYPWGEEAFEAARRENKPIFLSIGYSTCYWCHVMERESFENPDVAALLNEYYIPIKVDREERPDVDDIYMTAVQVMTRRGGWPLSLWLEPDTLKPFFGGTYFPVEGQGQRPGFMQLLTGIHQAWSEQQPELRSQADKIAEAVVNRLAATPEPANPDPSVVEAAISQVMSSYDTKHAGYGDAPKFPMPVHLDMLIETAWDRPDVEASLRHTLDRMAMGGMYDQVGGGFHRYSTDEKWLVPHFEKMLYDNGMLASVYAEVYERTANDFYAEIVTETLDYVLREMVDETGAFWSAQDAESNAREGQSYLWTSSEVRAALAEAGLPEAWGDFAIKLYGLERGTNFRDPHHPEEPASNVLFLSATPDELATKFGMTTLAFRNQVVRINAAMLTWRDRRDQPSTDDKILAGWNGLMIGGMADAGRVLEEQRYLDAARGATDWIRASMWTEDSGLRRTARAGKVSEITGFLEDYAFLVRGLLRLYKATGNAEDLAWAIELMNQAKTRFFDVEQGWLDAPDGDPNLFVRGRSLYDGAVPSGTSVMLDNQRQLHVLTQDVAWLTDAEATLRPIASTLNRSPRGAGQAIAALHHLRAADPARFHAAESAASDGPVDVLVATKSVQLNTEDRGNLTIVMRLKSPWHVALAGTENVMPVRIVSATPGVEVDVKWPEGKPYQDSMGSMQVLDGVNRISMSVVRTDAAVSAMKLSVSWQACDDSVCLQPETETYSVQLLGTAD